MPKTDSKTDPVKSIRLVRQQPKVMELLAIGLLDCEIAYILDTPPASMRRSLIQKLLRRYNVSTVKEMVKLAIKYGHIPKPTITRKEALYGIPIPRALCRDEATAWGIFETDIYVREKDQDEEG